MAEDANVVAQQLGRRLAVWGGSSVLMGGLLALGGSTSTQRAFGRQNALWGAIDVAIAGVAAARANPTTSGALRKLLLVNVGLDVLYIAAGAHIAVRQPLFGGRISTREAVGHGSAVVVQGAALLVLDATHARRL